MILLAPAPSALIRALRRRLMLISGVLLGWLLLVAGGLSVRSRRVVNP